MHEITLLSYLIGLCQNYVRNEMISLICAAQIFSHWNFMISVVELAYKTKIWIVSNENLKASRELRHVVYFTTSTCLTLNWYCSSRSIVQSLASPFKLHANNCATSKCCTWQGDGELAILLCYCYISHLVYRTSSNKSFSNLSIAFSRNDRQYIS